MYDQPGDGALRVFDSDVAIGPGDHPVIAHLPAALGVEAGLRKDDFNLLIPGGVSNRLAVAQDAEDAGFYRNAVRTLHR